MLLYKYRSIDDLWLTLDIIYNKRLWCAKWDTLNDPLEGRYEIFFSNVGENFRKIVENKRDSYRICSFSKSLNNFLLWSHYSSGHKGIAIEIDIPDNLPDLCKVNYQPFSPIFTEIGQSNNDLRYLFETKTREWEYEEEYRIISKEKYYCFDNPIRRIYVGPKVNIERFNILRSIIPQEVELIKTELDITQAKVIVTNGFVS